MTEPTEPPVQTAVMRKATDMFGVLERRINQFIEIIQVIHNEHETVMMPLGNTLYAINAAGADYQGLLPIPHDNESISELRVRSSPISSEVTKILPDLRKIVHTTMGSYQRLLDHHETASVAYSLVMDKRMTLFAFMKLMDSISRRVEQAGLELPQQQGQATQIAAKLGFEHKRLNAIYEAFTGDVSFH